MRLLLVNQTFYPDYTATAQYLTELAENLAASGFDVTVLCSRSDYLDHTRKYQRFEKFGPISIHRVGAVSFPRTSKFSRYLSAISMLLSMAWRLIRLPRYDAVLVMTTPPLIDALCVLLRGFGSERLFFWAMDVNPDQAIKTGWISEQSTAAKVLRRIQRWSLKRFERIVALDSEMVQLLIRNGGPSNKVTTLPLWTDHSRLESIRHSENTFRQGKEWADKFVVMYSGNHSICHPLDTLLRAAQELQARDNIAFVFIGGGARFGSVVEFREAHSLSNIYTYPYQPRNELSYCLSAADLHVVSMGDPFVGIVHPSKLYHILACGRAVMLIGGTSSPLAEVVRDGDCGVCLEHGDVAGVVENISALAEQGSLRLRELGRRAFEHSRKFDRATIAAKFAGMLRGE